MNIIRWPIHGLKEEAQFVCLWLFAYAKMCIHIVPQFIHYCRSLDTSQCHRIDSVNTHTHLGRSSPNAKYLWKTWSSMAKTNLLITHTHTHLKAVHPNSFGCGALWEWHKQKRRRDRAMEQEKKSEKKCRVFENCLGCTVGVCIDIEPKTKSFGAFFFFFYFFKYCTEHRVYTTATFKIAK